MRPSGALIQTLPSNPVTAFNLSLHGLHCISGDTFCQAEQDVACWSDEGRSGGVHDMAVMWSGEGDVKPVTL